MLKPKIIVFILFATIFVNQETYGFHIPPLFIEGKIIELGNNQITIDTKEGILELTIDNDTFFCKDGTRIYIPQEFLKNTLDVNIMAKAPEKSEFGQAIVVYNSYLEQKIKLDGGSGNLVWYLDFPFCNCTKYNPIAEQIQNILLELGYDVGKADGIFGEKSQIALRKFESNRGFGQQGIPRKGLLESLKEAAKGKGAN